MQSPKVKKSIICLLECCCVYRLRCPIFKLNRSCRTRKSASRNTLPQPLSTINRILFHNRLITNVSCPIALLQHTSHVRLTMISSILHNVPHFHTQIDPLQPIGLYVIIIYMDLDWIELSLTHLCQYAKKICAWIWKISENSRTGVL